MNKLDGQKTIEFIEGYYHRKLETSEIKALSEELKDYTYEDFINELKFPLLKKVEYFTVANLHKIILENKEIEEYKKNLGIKSLDELYEN